MRKKTIIILLLALVLCLGLAACEKKQTNTAANDFPKAPIADGTYTADFKTDGSMFHVNEALKGKGTLTVKDGAFVVLE